MSWFRLMAVSAALILIGATPAPASGLSEEDRRAIRANIEAYRDAWLRGDAEGVMATLEKDAVLIPSGLNPVVGERAIRAFWWPPEGPKTTVLAMELDVQEIGGDSKVAHARGAGSLRFSYPQDDRERVVTVQSTFLNVLRRQPDGSWKTVWRMWSDLRGK